MGSDGGYDLTEIFAIKFVLADVVIIFALIFAGWQVALAITIIFVITTFLVWQLTRDRGSADAVTETERATADGDVDGEESGAVDPVTTLQERYAAGELTEAEFEDRLDRLIEANERADRAGIETEELSLERSK